MNQDRFIMPSSQRPRSQVRALVRDLAGLMTQQMFFWGCDAQHHHGNLLVRLGAQRIARENTVGEGSSRYRFACQAGTVELHSFCAGWYPSDPNASGVVFIRGRERFAGCAGATPLTPGRYEVDRLRFSSADEMLVACRPLLAWLEDYEQRLGTVTREGYRDRCYALFQKRGEGCPWLPPSQARRWLAQWLASPENTPRARHSFRHPKRQIFASTTPKRAS